MSYLTEQKEKRCRMAIEAASKGRWNLAFQHAVAAARFDFDLAEQADGDVRRAYLADAYEWTELARKLAGRADKGRADKDRAARRADESSDAESAPAERSQWLTTERPKERLTDVVGLDEMKEVVKGVIDAVKFPELYKSMRVDMGGGALMYGPPGNGKTLIARAIAGEMNAAFFAVSGATIKNKYVGETEKNMRALFEEADKFPVSVVFIDEIQALLSRRGNEKANAVDEFLVCTDGVERRKNTLLLLGATNHPWLLDPAVFRRMKNLIYVGLPDREARRKIFEAQFQGIPYDETLEFDEFASRTEGFSGADIALASDAAKRGAIRRAIDGASDGTVPAGLLTNYDVFNAIASTNPTVSAATIKLYRDWENEFYGRSKGTN